MTLRLNESSGCDFGAQSDARPNQVSLSPQREEEGCPVIEESGTVCGETRTLNILRDFREIYDNCMRKMEGNKDDNLALKKLAPFKKLVEDLWEQNAMLVETVEELEEEAANRVTMLQNKLDECSEKVNEYLQDIDSLIEVIRRFRQNGKLDSKGLKFNSVCDFEIHGSGKSSCCLSQETNAKELYNKIAILKKDSENFTMRDPSTNAKDFDPSEQSKNISRSISRERDTPQPSTSSVFFPKSVLKLSRPTFEKPEKCYECHATKSNCECEGSDHIYRTPDEDLSMEGLRKDNYRSIEKNKSELIKSQLNVNFGEDVKNIESFYSAEDCTKETERRGRSDGMSGPTIRKFDVRISKNTKDEQIKKKGGVDGIDQENVGPGGALAGPTPIRSSFDSLHEDSDIENVLKQKDREIWCLRKELSGKDELLSKYCSQIDDLKRDLKSRTRKYQQVLNRLKDAAVKRLSTFSVEDLNIEGRELDDGGIEILFNTILEEMDNQKLKFAKCLQESEYDARNVTAEKCKVLSEKTDLKKCLEELRSENSALRNELSCFKNVLIENEGLQRRLEEMKGERDQLLEKVNTLHHSIQELDTSFKETRWALTAEVAEKHDQIQELKRTLVCLEEQVRQADMKTLFKDDVIKEMRKELKNSRTPNKSTSFIGSPGSENSDGVIFLARPGAENVNEREESFFEEMSQQRKLENIKHTLSLKIQRTEVQDECIEELECQLRAVKKDLASLKEKFDVKSHHVHGLAKCEAKLKNFKEVLLCSTRHLESALRNMSDCQSCNRCTCKHVIGEEWNAIECIKRDLESLQLKTCTLESHPMSDSVTNASEIKRERIVKKYKSLNENDVDNFRIKAVTGVAALEEMKEQIDILHGIIKKYYSQLPCDYEKCEIEECENKFNKLHSEFEEITDSLCELVESFSSSRSDTSDSGHSKKKTFNDVSKNSSVPEKMTKLQGEQKRLQKEINEQRFQLETIKNQITQVEKELNEKRCQSNEQDREIKSRDLEISRLREGVKTFRERLRDMQVDVNDTSNVNDTINLMPSLVSCSSLSLLSTELQDLFEILTNSQTSLPGIIEACKEENQNMKKKLNCLETCLSNKDKTLSFLQQSLKMREGQVEDLNCQIQNMNAELENLRKETEEKTTLICNLEDSMKKTKDFEMKIKDENIEELQFEICEMEFKVKAMAKEVSKKGKDIELLQDEILYVSSKNFFMSREVDILESKLRKLQKNLIIYENMVCGLQDELKSREFEIEQLYEKVKELEQEMECELVKCERKTQEDSECINGLTVTIRNLENELHCIKANARNASHIKSTDNSFEEHEDRCQKTDLKSIIRQLRGEVKALKTRLKQTEKKEGISSKIVDLKNIIRQRECRQQKYNEKIHELQKIIEETVTVYDCEKKKLMQKLCREEKENKKNKSVIFKLNESLKLKAASEDALKENVERITSNLECVGWENERLRAEIDAAKEKMRNEGIKDNFHVKEMDKLINDLEAQKSNLRVQCRELRSELDKEEKLKKYLEEKIKSLNDILANKTLQFNELSKSHKCASAKAKEEILKLKKAEDHLKCMKIEMNRKRICDDYDEDEDRKGISMESRCLEDCLEVKTAECSDLMSEVQCLEVKLKAMQGEYISAQANKDCELTRLKGELASLECKLNHFEKENFRLRNDLIKARDDLKSKSKLDNTFKDELDAKEQELSEALCEKNALLKSVENLQKRLEEMCLDSTRKEKENRDLRDECVNLKKQLADVECELGETRRDLEDLQNQYAETMKKLKCTENKVQNIEKLYCRVNQENAILQEAKTNMERQLCEAKNENFVLKEKMLCSKTQKDAETKKLMAENANASQEKMRYCSKVKELSCKMKNLEEHVIPQLENEIMRKDRCIENYRIELQEANASSQRMRDESMKVIQCTKKYLAAQRYANENQRMRAECSKDNRHYSNNETRELEEQLKRVTCLNEHLYFELQSEKNDYQDIEPRSFSPLPWGCSSVERDNSSPEFLAESGFQSMQQSPTNMNYINDYGPDMKRTPSQWNNNGRNMDNTDYLQCKNNCVR